MNAIQRIQEMLPGMTEAEKATVLRFMVGEVSGHVPGIETAPEVCGGDPCVVRTRIPVWLLEKWRRLGVSNDQLLEMYPTLRHDDLLNAWAYVAANTRDIDEQIHVQENV